MKQANSEQPLRFTKEMKKTHKILVPMMLPIHFTIVERIFRGYGYDFEVLRTQDRSIVDEGLKNVHNDTCYPALLVIGQMIDALKSGKYDTEHVALLITQTGGGCRASNYIHLLRKALKRSGFENVPVISLNFSGLEDNPGFQITVPMLFKIFYALHLADMMMLVANQCRPYELNAGDTDRMVEHWVDRLMQKFGENKLFFGGMVKRCYRELLDDFASIPQKQENKPKVGIVGEIYVKYAPLGNNDLEKFLLSEGAEPVVPGLIDFCLYCIYNQMVDHELYGSSSLKLFFSKAVYKMIVKRQQNVIDAIKEHGVFRAPSSFDHTRTLVDGYINHGVKMGEGWLLTAEMLELLDQGVNNIVCAQPFGCLPNHIVGKGMIRLIKQKNPQANIVAVDYDPGATKINQENRIKLMLANAQ